MGRVTFPHTAARVGPALGPAAFLSALINWALNKYDAITSDSARFCVL